MDGWGGGGDGRRVSSQSACDISGWSTCRVSARRPPALARVVLCSVLCLADPL